MARAPSPSETQARREDAAAMRSAMERYAAGEDVAFADLYDLLSPRLYGFLVKQTRDAARAEDVLQQTFLQIHRARGRFIPGADVVPWAFAIARRLVIDGHRKSRREVLRLDDDSGGEETSLRDRVPSTEAAQDDVVAGHELAAKVATELARLPAAQRIAFELVKEEGLTIAEAASVLGTTVTAVKLRAHRAYEALRRALGDSYGAASRKRASEGEAP